MRKLIVPPFVLLILFIGFSCVSKKKFIEMQDGRLKAEQEVRNLTENVGSLSARIKTMISDFEAMKTELLESNAIKDQYIDSLNTEITRLSGNLTKQDESLAQKEFTLDFEKRRLTEDLNERDKQIKQFELQLTTLKNDLKNKSGELDEKSFTQDRMNDKINVLESEKITAGQNLSELQGRLKQANNEISQLKSEGKKKDETIARLENNVKLLKKEMENK